MAGTIKTLQKFFVALVVCSVVSGVWASQASALSISDAIYFGGTAYLELADVQGRGLDFTPLESSMQNVFSSFSLDITNISAIGALPVSNYGQEDWTFTNDSDSALYDVQFLVTFVYVDEGSSLYGEAGIAGDDLYIVPIAGVYVAAFDLGDIAAGATSGPVTLQYHAPNGFSAGVETDYVLPMTGYGLYANTVPEPSAALLFALGILIMGIYGRRKWLGN
jgi:hypothetical protein